MDVENNSTGTYKDLQVRPYAEGHRQGEGFLSEQKSLPLVYVLPQDAIYILAKFYRNPFSCGGVKSYNNMSELLSNL